MRVCSDTLNSHFTIIRGVIKVIKEKNLQKIIPDFTYISDKELNQTLKDQEISVGETLNLTEQEAGILYITDDANKAKEAKEKGLAVLIYLHEGNTEQSFEGFRFYIEGFEDAPKEYYQRVYQREMGIPWEIAQTERLRIREMAVEDTDALYKLYQDKSVVRYMEDLPLDREEEKVYIRDYIDKVYGVFGFGMWLIELKDTGKIIGRVGFQNYEKENQVELGFLIEPKYQRCGYAYEACMAALEYIREEFDYLEVVIRCHRNNGAAVALCKKLGMECILIES